MGLTIGAGRESSCRGGGAGGAGPGTVVGRAGGAAAAEGAAGDEGEATAEAGGGDDRGGDGDDSRDGAPQRVPYTLTPSSAS